MGTVDAGCETRAPDLAGVVGAAVDPEDGTTLPDAVAVVMNPLIVCMAIKVNASVPDTLSVAPLVTPLSTLCASRMQSSGNAVSDELGDENVHTSLTEKVAPEVVKVAPMAKCVASSTRVSGWYKKADYRR